MTRRCLPVADWPVPDREAWDAAHRRGELLDDDGLAANWAPATSSIIARGYGRFLSFLTGIGDLDLSQPPAQRVTRPRVEVYVTHLRERNHSTTAAARVRELSEAMRIMAPDADWHWLRRIRSRLQRMSTPARDDRTRLVPAAAIIKLHSDLKHLAENGEHLSDWKRAVLFRDALILAVLIVCPNRARPVAAMAMGTTLQRRGNEWWVAFGPPHMKNKRPFEAPLPGLAPLIERYIEHYRPFLVARSIPRVAGNALWISSNGRPLSSTIIGLLVRRRTEREFGRGRHLNLHLFRKIVPTELALNDPEHVGVAQPLLGHTNYGMTERAYNLGRAIDAARRHHEVLRAIRGTGARTRKASRGAGHSEASTKRKGSPRPGTPHVFKKQ